MKKLIFLLLFVITIPVTCVHAQSEIGRGDTMHLRALDTTRLWNISDSFRYVTIDTTKPHVLFLQDQTWCEWHVVMMGGETILKVEDDGSLWYVPRWFCHCYYCHRKTKLTYWGNINGRR